jgi:hypothetical protein
MLSPVVVAPGARGSIVFTKAARGLHPATPGRARSNRHEQARASNGPSKVLAVLKGRTGPITVNGAEC